MKGIVSSHGMRPQRKMVPQRVTYLACHTFKFTLGEQGSVVSNIYFNLSVAIGVFELDIVLGTELWIHIVVENRSVDCVTDAIVLMNGLMEGLSR